MSATPSIQFSWDGPGAMGAGNNGDALIWDNASGKWIAGSAGVTDHGALTGLSDDDHSQYLLVDGSRAMTGPIAAPNGSQSAPSYGFANSAPAGMGWYLVGGNLMGWSAGGVGRGYLGRWDNAFYAATTFIQPVTAAGITVSVGSNLSVAGGELSIIEDNAAAVPLSINLASGQTANALDIKDSAAAHVVGISPSGSYEGPSSGSSDWYVRPNGSTSAYLRFYQASQLITNAPVTQIRASGVNKIDVRSSGIGFFNATPAGQQTGVTPAVALQNLGLGASLSPTLPLDGSLAMTGGITFPNTIGLNWGGVVQVRATGGGAALELGNPSGQRMFVYPNLSSEIVQMPSARITQNQNVVMLAVRGASGQTNDLQQWKNSSDSVLARVNSGGRFLAAGWVSGTDLSYAVGSANTGFGAAGGWNGPGLWAGGVRYLDARADAGWEGVYINAGNTSQENITVRKDGSNGKVLIAKAADKLGFYGATEIVKPTVTGSRGGNAALASLLTELANLGLITDSTS